MRSECPSKRGASGRKAARPVGLPMGVDSNADIERRFQAALAQIKRSRQFSITEEIATSQAVAWGDLIGQGDDYSKLGCEAITGRKAKREALVAASTICRSCGVRPTLKRGMCAVCLTVRAKREKRRKGRVAA